MQEDSILLPQRSSLAARPAPIELSIVVPTFNESENVPLLVERVADALEGIAWEIIFVDDDSPDHTAEVIRQMARRRSNVRCLWRIGRRGLSTACVEGALASTAPFIAVMDADLQHEERLLPAMLETLRRGDFDVVVGSRYVAGGSIGEWSSRREWISRFATRVAHRVLRVKLSDPMSGFFMMTQGAFHGAVRRLSGQGFKILLDLFASSSEPLRVKELPYTFRERAHGESKLDSAVVWEFGMMLVDKLLGGLVPSRFVLFAAVGVVGLAVHTVALYASIQVGSVHFTIAQVIATITAMIFNFALNNAITYRDKRLRGLGFVGGLLTFCAACSVGAVANVGVADFVFASGTGWWLAGMSGALMGAVFNYAVTSVFTWRK